MRQFSVLFVAMTMTAMVASAQRLGAIEGFVFDARTGAPLGETNVWVKDRGKGEVSNFRGHFRLDRLAAGEYPLVFSFIGYERHDTSIVLAEGEMKYLEVSLKERPIILVEEIVVTAGRVVGYRQSDILIKETAAHPQKDLGEFLRSVPNVSAIRRGGYGLDPVLRGFRSDQLNVQIDGEARVEGACPSRMDPPASHVTAGDLEKIEVLKGPFALRFGPSFGGVINLVMAAPEQYETWSVGGNLTSGYDSTFNGWQNRLTINGGSRLYDFRLSGGIKKYGDYTDGHGETVPSNFTKRDFTLKFGVNPLVQHRLQLSLRHVAARDIQFPSLPMDERKDDTRILIADYAAKNLSSVLASLTLKAYRSDVDHTMDNRFRPTAATVTAETHVSTAVSGARAEVGMIVGSSVLFVGTDFMRTEKSGLRTRTFLTGPRAGATAFDNVWQDARITNAGVFLEYRSAIAGFQFIGSWRLDVNSASPDKPDAGFRDLYGSLKLKQINPSFSFGLTRTLSRNVELAAHAGRGVRSAGIAERYINFFPIGLDRLDYVGNPFLKPEVNTTIDVGLRGRTMIGTVSGSLFYSHVTDYISSEITPLPAKNPDVFGVKRFCNIESATLAGFELTSVTEVADYLHLQLKASYTRARNNRAREPLPEIPPLDMTAVLAATMMGGKVLPEVSVRAAAAQRDISPSFGETPTPGFVVVNGALRLKPHRVINATIGVNNVFNKAYYEHLNRRLRTTGTPINEPGRSFFANIEISAR
ncbi:MAG: TonB-dependent receptor [Ignavibacteria bacterium]|nr:TonB-dependent receptor [Ignavibacteria bacterium]